MKWATSHPMRTSANKEAVSVEDRLAVSMSFIKAIHMQEWARAKRLQTKYAALLLVKAREGAKGTSAFWDLLDHVMELSHTSIQDRLDSLRGMKDSLSDQVYSQRKKNLLASLKRLLLAAAPTLQLSRILLLAK